MSGRQLGSSCARWNSAAPSPSYRRRCRRRFTARKSSTARKERGRERRRVRGNTRSAKSRVGGHRARKPHAPLLHEPRHHRGRGKESPPTQRNSSITRQPDTPTRAEILVTRALQRHSSSTERARDYSPFGRFGNGSASPTDDDTRCSQNASGSVKLTHTIRFVGATSRTITTASRFRSGSA